jgi:hypothetical protein
MTSNKPDWSKAVAGGLIEFPEPPEEGVVIPKKAPKPRPIKAPLHVIVGMAKADCPAQVIADELGVTYSHVVRRLNGLGQRIWLDWEELEAVRAARRGARDGA